MKHRLPALVIAILILASGCAIHHPIPPELTRVNPAKDCPASPRPISWKLHGELHTDSNGVQWLILDIDPGFTLVSDPVIELKKGLAVLEFKRNNRYYFNLGRQPAVREFGLLSLETPAREHRRPSPEYWDSHVPVDRNDTETFVLERRRESSCIKILIR